jgi:hypothetical protein
MIEYHKYSDNLGALAATFLLNSSFWGLGYAEGITVLGDTVLKTNLKA